MTYGTVNADLMGTSSGQTLGAGNATAFKNRIINGAMEISQRGTSFTGLTSGTYCIDRFNASIAAGGTWTVTQDTDVPSGSGFVNSWKYLCTTSAATPNQLRIAQTIEGYNVSDSAYGTSGAKTFTLSFWIKSNKNGGYAASIETTTAGRYYNAPFTINSADTWEYKTLTITGDTTGTLNTTNGSGFIISIWCAAGASLTGSGTQNAWTTNVSYTNIAQGQTVNLADATNNYLNLTGVQFELGSLASSFDWRPYGTELSLCQRYYQQIGGTSAYTGFGSGVAGSTTVAAMYIKHNVSMRASPTFGQSNCGIQDNQNIFAVTTLNGTYNGPDSGMYIVGASGTPLTQYRPYLLTGNNNTAAYITLSAEL